MLVMLYYSEEEDGEDPQSAFIVAGAHNIEQVSGDEDYYAISTYQNHEQYDPVAVSILLYCIVLYCIALHCIVLYCIILYYETQ